MQVAAVGAEAAAVAAVNNEDVMKGGGGHQWRQQHLMEATQQLASVQRED